MVCTPPDTGDLEELFRHEVSKMLKAEGKNNDAVIENMMNPADGGTESAFIAERPSGHIMNSAAGGGKFSS